MVRAGNRERWMKNPLNSLTGWAGPRRLGVILAGGGALLIVGGLPIFVPPLVGVLQRSHTDAQALHKWKDPGAALNKKLPTVKTINQPGVTPVATAPSCGSGSPARSHPLIDFPRPSGGAGGG